MDSTWSSHLPPSGRIGRYVLQAELGRGGMGVVWRAHDPALGRFVAIKMILGAELDVEAQERFVREARVSARLRHPGIVGVHDAGVHAGRPYIAMDYVDGESLEAHFIRGRIPVRRIATIVRDLAVALAAAHAEGVIHRDVKPQNVLVDREGRVRLTDFGLARDLASTIAKRQLTMTGEVIGTPAYMAPEQASGVTSIPSPGMDIWAVGAILYRGLTGRPPFDGPTALAVLQDVIAGQVERPRALFPSIPDALDAITMHCLEHEATDRYPSMQRLADDLGRWLDGASVTVRRPGAIRRLGRHVRREPIVALAGALAVVSLVATVAAVAALLAVSESHREVAAALEQAEAARVEATEAEAARREAEARADERVEASRAAPASGSRSAAVEGPSDLRRGWLSALEDRATLFGRRGRYTEAWALAALALADAPKARVAGGLSNLRQLAPWVVQTTSRRDPAGARAGVVIDAEQRTAVTVGRRDLTVWDLTGEAWRARDVIPGPFGGYDAVAISSDGRRLAANRSGRVAIEVWELAPRSGEPVSYLGSFVGERDIATRSPPALAFGALDRVAFAAVGTNAGSFETGEWTGRAFPSRVPEGARLITLDARGEWLAYAQGDGGVVVQSIAAPRAAEPIAPEGRRPTVLRFVEAGEGLAVGWSDGGVSLHRSADGVTRWRTAPHGAPVTALDADGARVVAAHGRDPVRVWSLATGAAAGGEIRRVDQLAPSGLLALRDRRLLVVDGAGRIGVSDAGGIETHDLYGHGSAVRQIIPDARGDRFVSISTDAICAWDGPRPVRQLDAAGGPFAAVGVIGNWTPSVPALALFARDGEVTGVDPAGASGRLPPVGAPITLADGGHSGSTVLVVGGREIVVRDTERVRARVVANGTVGSVAIDPTGRRFAWALRGESTVRFRDLDEAGAEVPELDAGAAVARVRLATVDTLVLVREDGRLLLAQRRGARWNRHPILVDLGPATVTALSAESVPGGSLAWAVGFADGRVRLSGRGSMVLPVAPVAVTALATRLPDRLWTGDAEGTLRVFEVPDGTGVGRALNAGKVSDSADPALGWGPDARFLFIADESLAVIDLAVVPAESSAMPLPRGRPVAVSWVGRQKLVIAFPDGSAVRLPIGASTGGTSLDLGPEVSDLRAFVADEDGVTLAHARGGRRVVAGGSLPVEGGRVELAEIASLPPGTPVAVSPRAAFWLDREGRLVRGVAGEAPAPVASAGELRGPDVAGIAVDRSGEVVALGGRGGSGAQLRIIGLRSGVDESIALRELPEPFVVAVSGDGGHVAATEAVRSVGVWSVGTGERLTGVGTRAPTRALAWSPDATHLAISAGREVHLAELRPLTRPLEELRDKTGVIFSGGRLGIERTRPQRLRRRGR